MPKPSIVTALLLSATLAACSDSSTPTSPRSPAPSPPAVPSGLSASWQGTWTFESAEPAGLCIVDAVNGTRLAEIVPPTALSTPPGEDRFEIVFWPGYLDNGLVPVHYAGGGQGGGLQLAPDALPWPFTAPFGESYGCWPSWELVAGSFSGELLDGGRKLRGSFVETYRITDNGARFTLRSHIELLRISE